MVKKDILLPNKDSSNYSLNKYYYDLSFPNSKSNRRSRKASISSIEDQISELDSCIEELYKIYTERKKIRLNKEKISQNMINRINYLTLEEKKIRLMLENQLKNKKNTNDKWKTNYNTIKNTPKMNNKRTKSFEYLKNNIINNKLRNISEMKKDKSLNKNDKHSNKSSTQKNNEKYSSVLLDSNTFNKTDKSKENPIYNIKTQKNKNKQNITNNIYIIINKNEDKMNMTNKPKYTHKNIKTIKDKKVNNKSNRNNKNYNSELTKNPSLFDEKDCVRIINEQKSQVKYLEKKLELKKDIMNKKDLNERNNEKSKKSFFEIFNIYNNNKKFTNTNIDNSKNLKVKTMNNIDLVSPNENRTYNNNNNLINKNKNKYKKNNSSYKCSIERKKDLMGLKLNNKERLAVIIKIKEDLMSNRFLTFENEKITDDNNTDNDNDIDYQGDINKATDNLKDKIKSQNNKNRNIMFNTSVNDNHIKIERKVNSPLYNEKPNTHKNNKKKFINSQININHKMIKKLFKQNKRNENKNSNVCNINNYRKGKILNNNAVKNEINTIRRINLQIENLKKNNFFERKKNNNDSHGKTIKKVKNIKKNIKNKSISELNHKKHTNPYNKIFQSASTYK